MIIVFVVIAIAVLGLLLAGSSVRVITQNCAYSRRPVSSWKRSAAPSPATRARFPRQYDERRSVGPRVRRQRPTHLFSELITTATQTRRPPRAARHPQGLRRHPSARR